MITFWKMHGAGNDFILIDDRDQRFPLQAAGVIRALCARRTGIGSDGLLLLQPSAEADLRMRFFNPDGGEAEMCGNAVRCLARLARDLQITGAAMSIQTQAGLVQATVHADHRVTVVMPPPDGARDGKLVLPDGDRLAYGFVNTGVPHAVIVTATEMDGSVQALGAAVRHHSDFAPSGTNVDFVTVTGPCALSVRTYERGVEQETLACGTGIVAAALVAARRGLVTPPVAVRSAGGETLQVDFRRDGDAVSDVRLTGPAVYVCRGTALHPDLPHARLLP